jgi:hypothetical protein
MSRLRVTMKLYLVETHHIFQQGFAIGRAQQCHRVAESHGKVEFDEANEIAATSAAIAVEEIFGGVHQKAGLLFGVQRAQSHEPPAGDAPGGFPIL